MSNAKLAPDLTIRAATVDDYSLVMQLMRPGLATHVLKKPHRFRMPEEGPWNPDKFSTFLEKEHQTVLLAHKGGQGVGFIFLSIREAADYPSYVNRRYGVVENLGVLPSMQGQGVAQALMGAAHGWFTAQNVQTVELSVYSFNDPALKLYEKLGYQVESLRMVKGL